MTNTNNDDPLIAEIEKMIYSCEKDEESYREFNPILAGQASAMHDTLLHVKSLVIADRQRQQAEKERILKALEALPYKHAIWEGYHSGGIDKQKVLEIIQGKEEMRARE